MTSSLLLVIILAIIIINFLFELLLNYLNAKHFKDNLPSELNDIYDEEGYQNSQNYKQVNYKFGLIQSVFSFVLLILFIALNGFKLLDDFVRLLNDNKMLISLLYFGFIFLASTIISLPFSYYHSFVIEERFGFNKMTKSLFVKDTLKKSFARHPIRRSYFEYYTVVFISNSLNLFGCMHGHLWLSLAYL